MDNIVFWDFRNLYIGACLKTRLNFNPSNTQSAPHTLRPYVYKRKHLFPSAQTF